MVLRELLKRRFLLERSLEGKMERDILEKRFKRDQDKLETLPAIGRSGTKFKSDKIAYWHQVPERYDVVNGDWLEFGVYEGTSAKAFLKNMPKDSKLYLFDSFEGLPEDWIPGYAKGHFACKVPVFGDNRVQIVKGWFEDTLPTWASEYQGKAALIHIDCDMYKSTKTVLKYIDHIINSDTLVLLDDYCYSENHLMHVFKAFQEYIDENKYSYEYLFRTPKKSQAAVLIKK